MFQQKRKILTLQNFVPIQYSLLAQRVWCAVKAQKKIFQGQGALHVKSYIRIILTSFLTFQFSS